MMSSKTNCQYLKYRAPRDFVFAGFLHADSFNKNISM